MTFHKESELYSKLSRDHQKEAARILEKYSHYLDFRPGETVLDVGCGSGDVTHNVILPSLHPSFSLLVGCDISHEMVEFANSRWRNNKRLIFRAMDIAESDPIKISQNLPTVQFDKIFSFFALQWVRNRRQLVENIYSFLKPGGQALLILVVNSGVYIVWDILAKSDKWSTYFKDVKVPFNEYQYMNTPDDVMKSALQSAGLEVSHCDVKMNKDVFASNIESDGDMIKKLKSVDPLLSLVPDQLKDDYMADVLAFTKKLVGPKGAVDYTSLTIICSKPITKS